MKDILFRGLWVHGNKEWIEGDLVRDSDGKPHIVDTKYAVYWGGESTFVCEDECEVLPETVGQYTGLTDKNGKKVFEGDIVEAYNLLGESDGIGVVQWSDTFAGWYISKTKGMYCADIMSYKIIGNVFDNPELLEVK